MAVTQVCALKTGLGLMAAGLLGYIVGRPLYWHLTEVFVTISRSSAVPACPPCLCDCSTQPLLSIPHGCVKHEAEADGEGEKNFADLLLEELKLREFEALESQQKGDMALLEAKKVASQYQKEADKCNSGMETCEEAREKAEEALEAQMKLSAMWELRAHQKGWREGIVNSNGQQQQNVQVTLGIQ